MLEALKRLIEEQSKNIIPGYLPTLDSIALKKTGSRFLDLFFSKPSKAYELLLEFYKDENTVDFLIVTVFLKPIAIKLNRLGLELQLLTLIKKKNDNDILKIFTELEKQLQRKQ